MVVMGDGVMVYHSGWRTIVGMLMIDDVDSDMMGYGK